MSTAKHTQGPVKHVPRARDGHCDQIAKGSAAFVMVGCPHVERPILDYPHDNEQTANAKLIEEAFNVSTETGRTPRQLSEDRAALLEACKVLMKAWDDGEEGNEVKWEGLVEAVNLAREAVERGND